MQLDFAAKQLTLKLVYYGPALSGKTTNLQALHRLVAPTARGQLMTLETREDRTLFFDLLPLTAQLSDALQVRLKVFTVPGQLVHNATRRIILQGVDGVAFIADSQIIETRHNQEAFREMCGHLQANGLSVEDLPMVLQLNKRDLPNIRSDEELRALSARTREPVIPSIATQGVGVVETLLSLLDLVWLDLDRKHGLQAKFGVSSEALLTGVREALGIREGA
ncbi:MAG: gliding motility protein [Myxococcales bacterium]|nr:gliding motility protein [Myxococcales bacterium]